MAYKNEAAFSRALIAQMRKRQWFVQRIETGTTGNGVPDIWAAYFGHDYWFELKNQFSISPVSWRPGQQGWHHKYHKYTGRSVYTVIALEKQFAVIALKKLYAHNIVPMSDVILFDTIHELLSYFETKKEYL